MSLASLLSRWSRHRHMPVFMLTLVSAVGMFFFLDPRLRGPDVESYYSYARSLFFDGDILLINEFELMQKATFITPTGYASVLANIGTAFFWLPFFALAHATIGATSTWLSTSFSTDGFGLFYALWINFGNWLYGLVTLSLIYRLSRRFFTRNASLSALFFTCFATPFFYYLSYFAPNTSIPSALVAVLVLWLWDQARRHSHTAHWLLLGSLSGIGLSIATYNGGFLIFPLLSLAGALRDHTPWRAVVRHGVAFGIGLLIGYLPQLLVWQIHYGVIANPYARQLEPLQPHVLEVLFSTYHGAYFYTPFLLLATLGIVRLWQRDRALALGMVGTFAVHAYATGVLLGWWAGASLGIRYFVGLTPLFALSAAALFENGEGRVASDETRTATRRWRSTALYALSCLCFAWTYLLFLSIYANGVSLLEYYPLEQQLANQWSALVKLPRLLAEHWQPVTSPLVLALLVPFTAGTYLTLTFGRALLTSARLRSNPRVVLTLALAPLLLSLLLMRAAQVGATHLQAAQARPDYQTLPRGMGDPLDLSATYNERGRYFLRHGDAQAADADFRRAQEIVSNNSYALLFGSDAARIPHRLDWQFGRGVVLAGYSLSSPSIHPSEPLWLALYWSVQSQPIQPYFVRLTLVEADGRVLVAVDDVPTQGQLAFRDWPVGALIRDQYVLSTPHPITATAALAVRVRLIDKETKQRLILSENDHEVDGVLTHIKVADGR